MNEVKEAEIYCTKYWYTQGILKIWATVCLSDSRRVARVEPYGDRFAFSLFDNDFFLSEEEAQDFVKKKASRSIDSEIKKMKKLKEIEEHGVKITNFNEDMEK